jgi:hypothetical protein
MNVQEFMQNCNAHSAEELARYEDQHVAWSEDGKQILAHAFDLGDLYKELQARQITRYVVGYIPRSDMSMM